MARRARPITIEDVSGARHTGFIGVEPVAGGPRHSGFISAAAVPRHVRGVVVPGVVNQVPVPPSDPDAPDVPDVPGDPGTPPLTGSSPAIFSASLVGIPVDAVRAWQCCVVPRSGSNAGWTHVKAYYTPPAINPVQFIISHLDAGTSGSCLESHWVAGKTGKYPNPAGASNVTNSQLRAPSGRVFMMASSTKTYYYDPADELVHDLGRVQFSGSDLPDSSTYSLVFNEAGTLLGGGTVATAANGPSGDHRPAAFTVDPVTLVVRYLARIGGTTRTLNGYCYYSWIVGNYLYCIVGQEFWDIVAVNLTTAVATTLATETVNGWGYFDQVGTKGVTVRLVKNNKAVGETTRRWWLINGTLVDYVSDADDIEVHDATPYSNKVVQPPQIDESLLAQHIVKWRPFGSTGAWTSNTFSVIYSSPIPVDSLWTLPDGSIFGDVEQYQGFFRITDGAIQNFTAFNGVTEGYARIVINGLMYFSGYANGPLYVYDPTKAWDSVTNPKLLGYFAPGSTLSGVKRAAFLAYGSNPSRLYMVGLRDRTASGAGIGYYNFATKKFFGHFTGLNFYQGHLGLVVVDSLAKVIMGGQIGDDPNLPGQTPTEAQLIVHDLDCVELERQTPIAGLLDTGKLFRTAAEPSVVIGLSPGGKLAYRWDFVSKTLLGTVNLSAYTKVGWSCQDELGTIYVCLDNNLAAMNPLTLDCLTIKDLGPDICDANGPVTAICASAALGTITVSAGTKVFSITST